MKIQKSIWYVLLLILGGLTYLFIFTYQNIQRHKESFHWVNHTHEVIENLNGVRSSFLDVESQLRGFVITGNKVFTQHYNSKSEELFRKISTLQKRTSDNAEQAKHATQLLALVQRKLAFQNEILIRSQTSRSEAEALISKLTGK